MTKEGRILVVDDNEELLVALRFYLESHVEYIETIKNPNLIPSILEEKSIDLVILDMNFRASRSSGNEGLFWLKKIKEIDSSISVVMITAYGDIDLAVKSIKDGAIDFIDKSWDEKKILSTILQSIKIHKTEDENRRLKKHRKELTYEVNANHGFCKCKSKVMQNIYELVEKISKTEANVLILGENGTGKEVIAREIHRLSHRKDELFIKVDLGSIPETLFESELFGYKAGAFTDAKENKDGRFEVANGGSLFLDEIGNLSLASQSKLLSVIQNKEVYRIGSNKPIKVDVRLICATNMSLEQMVKDKLFREDLIYRINTIQIDLPPLRERKEDIPLLAEFYLNRFTKQYNKTHLSINAASYELLTKHDWPGNIRELEHTIEKGVILATGKEIQPIDIFSNQKSKPKPIFSNNFSIEENEKSLIIDALEFYKWNLTVTAEKLGINRSTLYAKIEKYGIKQV